MSGRLEQEVYTAPPAPASPGPASRERRALPATFFPWALGGLVMLAGLVVFWLPGQVQRPPAPDSAPPTPSVPAAAAPTEPRLLPEPEGAREAAQQALVEVMETLDALRAQRITDWAPGVLDDLETLQAAGEAAYRARQYTAARREYATAMTQAESARERLPDILAQWLDEGEQALRSDAPREAAAAFARVLAVAPEDPAALEGQQRARHWDRVIALLAEGQGYERMGDAAQAETAYRAALALDAKAAEASRALARLATQRAEEAFNAEMSHGYAALGKQDFSAAQRRFEAARALRPKAPEVLNALAQTAARATAARLQAALGAAAAAEKKEDWSTAERHYKAAFALDAGLASAREGAARAGRRAALARRFEEMLRDPARLADDGVARAAESLLRDARLEQAPGPNLAGNLARLTEALKLARTPLPVSLASDGETVVEILGKGVLGRFSREQITLLPGRYTARGSRPGYRDVRVEFEIRGDGSTPLIAVQCRELLPFGR